MTKIFISYRRNDAPDMAERIYARLQAAFGRGNVFIDVDDIPSGARFAEYLSQTLVKSDAMLVIIGAQWLTVTTPAGNRRLDQPGDFVRLEIEAALQRGLVLLPVLVQGTSVPAVADLPESLRGLVAHQALQVRRNPDFERDMTRLIEAIQQQVRQQARQRAAQKRAQRWAAAKRTVMAVPRLFSRLITQPAGRIGCLGLAVLLVLVSTAVLFQSGTLHGFPFVGSSGSSTPTATPSPTFDAPAATHAAARALATASSAAATATAVFAAPYAAPIPGKCDQGGATWQSSENSGLFPGQMSCAVDSLAITGHAWAQFEGAPGRAGYSATGIPPLHFRASVDASFGSSGANGSPEIVGQFDATGYVFQIHSDGTWALDAFTSNQNTGGNTGKTRAAASYTLALTVENGSVAFSVNNAQVVQMNLASGGGQSTGTFIGNDSGGPISCKNFVFTPLP